MPDRGRTLLLIDVYALVYRAFFALPPLTSPDGRPVNAVYGFERMLNRVLADEQPTHVAAAFDAGIPAERLEAYPEYKAHRPETPDDLGSQFPLVRRALEAYGIPIVEVEGEEADDVIATLAERASKDQLRTVIVSGDLDLLQLVDDAVSVVVTRRGISDMARYDEAAVRERYGLAPLQLPDYRGLKGDPSDNLPGVPGIGEKTAAKLIAQYGTLENLLAHADEVTPKRIGELLARYAGQARACRDVSIAKRDLPLTLRWEDAELRGKDPSARNALFQELGFRSLMTSMPGAQPRNDVRSRQEVQSRPLEAGDGQSRAQERGTASNDARAQERGTASRGSAVPSAVAVAPREVATQRLVDDRAGALELLARVRRSKEFAFAPLPELTAWRQTEPLAFALATERSEAYVVPAALALHDDAVRGALAEVLGDASVGKIVHGAKALSGWLAANGLPLAGLTLDTQLSYGLLDGGRVDPSLADALAYAGEGETYKAPTPSAQAMDLFAQGPAVEAVHASAAEALLRAAPFFRARIAAAGMEALLCDVEQPLAPVLASMERAGFRLDLDELARIHQRLERIMAETSSTIFRLAGGEFNINSPKALGEVLFEKLGLPHGGKTKTGYATGSDILAPLAAQHEIAAKVLEYREVSKLKGTYVDALPALIDPKTGLLHTTLHQLGAATGRLSSSDPNLQNIPIRSAAGREIRRAFLAPTPGNVLLAADYSQIELRLFAHLSGDPNLIDAFARGEDIHEYAARAVFNVKAGTPVDAEMRRRAKAVNFGILYGQGEVGLAQSVGFSRKEAREFIGAYFTRFPRVHEYIDDSLERARAVGYVTTLLGRRRWLPDLRSSNYGLRAAAERMATNAPLQGSAADLIKLAMIRVARALREQAVRAHLVLQVHDELIFDVPPADVGRVRAIAKDAMENAMQVSVPLVVDFKVGPTWGEAEAADG
jgi:DNA polymerase-1